MPCGAAIALSKSVEKEFEASRPTLFAALLHSVSELGYSITNSDAALGVLSFTTGMSFRSWAGQSMTATVLPLSTSRSKLIVGGTRVQRGNPFGGGGQIFDWGEKDVITDKLLDAVDRVLSANQEQSRVEHLEYERIHGDVESRLVADELEKLASLRTRGVITEDEFVTAKTKLLA